MRRVAVEAFELARCGGQEGRGIAFECRAGDGPALLAGGKEANVTTRITLRIRRFLSGADRWSRRCPGFRLGPDGSRLRFRARVPRPLPPDLPHQPVSRERVRSRWRWRRLPSPREGASRSFHPEVRFPDLPTPPKRKIARANGNGDEPIRCPSGWLSFAFRELSCIDREWVGKVTRL